MVVCSASLVSVDLAATVNKRYGLDVVLNFIIYFYLILVLVILISFVLDFLFLKCCVNVVA